MPPFYLPALLPGPYSIELSGSGGSAGTLEGVTDHVQSGLNLLISQYQDSPRLKALAASYLQRVNEVELGVVQAYTSALDLDTAQGDQLDLIGRVVREPRGDSDDETYRRALRVRVLINRSQGRAEDLIQIVTLFEDITGTVRVQDVQPARVEVEVLADPTNPPGEVHRRLVQAKAAGVSLTTTVVAPTQTLGSALVLGTGPGLGTATLGFLLG